MSDLFKGDGFFDDDDFLDEDEDLLNEKDYSIKGVIGSVFYKDGSPKKDDSPKEKVLQKEDDSLNNEVDNLINELLGGTLKKDDSHNEDDSPNEYDSSDIVIDEFILKYGSTSNELLDSILNGGDSPKEDDSLNKDDSPKEGNSSEQSPQVPNDQSSQVVCEFSDVNQLIDYFISKTNFVNAERNTTVSFDGAQSLSNVPLALYGDDGKVKVVFVDGVEKVLNDYGFRFIYFEEALDFFRLAGVEVLVVSESGNVLVHRLSDVDVDYITSVLEGFKYSVIDSLMDEEDEEINNLIESLNGTSRLKNSKIIAIPNVFNNKFFSEGSFHYNPNGKGILRCKNSHLNDFIVSYDFNDERLTTLSLQEFNSLENLDYFIFNKNGEFLYINYDCPALELNKAVSYFLKLLHLEFENIGNAIKLDGVILYSNSDECKSGRFILKEEIEVSLGYTVKVFVSDEEKITLAPSLSSTSKCMSNVDVDRACVVKGCNNTVLSVMKS